MSQWQQEYNSNPHVRALSAKFDDYKTVDWRHEKHHESVKYYEALSNRNSNRNNNSNNEEEEVELSNFTSNFSFNFPRPSTGVSLISLTSAMSLIQDISTLNLIKSRLWTSVQSILVLTISGVCIGCIAALLSVFTDYLNELKELEISSYSIIQFITYFSLSIIFGTLASIACVFISPTASGSGISEVKCIVSGFNRPSFLTLRTLIIKALSLPLTIASGLAVGKEGPSVHYASCVGDFVSRTIVPWFGESPIVLTEVITASAGAGVAVAFGSPLGGVLFAIEEIWGRAASIRVLWRTFYMSLIAITVLKIWNPFGTGQIVMFSVNYERDWVWSEVFWFLILGIFGGVYGVCVIKWNIKWVAFRRGFMKNGGWNSVWEVSILCGISAIVGWWNPFLRGDMTKIMENLFEAGNKNDDYENMREWIFKIFQLVYAIFIRIILVCISYGCSVPCGIFVPSMAIGATFGKLLGILVESISSNEATNNIGVSSGTYAFLGAGAALSGVTGLHVTVVVILYELTGAIKYIIPSMVVVIGVKIVVEICGNGYGGIADQMIKFNGMPYIDLKEEHEFINEDGGEVIAQEVMVPIIYGIDINGMKLTDVGKILDMNKGEYPLLQDRKYIIGVIKRYQLEKMLNRAIEEGKMELKFHSSPHGEIIEVEEIEFEFSIVKFDTSMYTVFDMFVNMGIRQVYVVDSMESIIGVISRKDIIRWENYEHYRHHCDENGQEGVFVDNRDREIFKRLSKVLYN